MKLIISLERDDNNHAAATAEVKDRAAFMRVCQLVWRNLNPPPPPEPKKLFIVTAGVNKIEVIKVIREFTGLGLKEAKDVVEYPSVAGRSMHIALLPGDLLEACDKALRWAGATTEIR